MALVLTKYREELARCLDSLDGALTRAKSLEELVALDDDVFPVLIAGVAEIVDRLEADVDLLLGD